MSSPQTLPDPKWGLRADGTKKDVGFLGPLALPNGGVASEYSIGVGIGGKEVEIPTLVPTLSKEEIQTMTQDIIPNRKPIPDAIFKKAVAHAMKRIRDGKSPFYSSSERE